MPRLFVRLLPLLAFAFVACADSNDLKIFTTVEHPGVVCPAGGQRIDITQDGKTTSTFTCNGTPGALGASGGDGASSSVSVGDVGPGDECPFGGKVIITTSGNEPAVTSYVCNGVDGQGVTMTPEPAGDECPRGGVKVQQTDGAPGYICNGDALAWESSGDHIFALPNRGYIHTGLFSRTLTLPESAALRVGDTIRLINTSSEGTVRVAPSEGQRFRYAPGSLSIPLSSFSNFGKLKFATIASSTDGKKLFAATKNGFLSTSTDSGATWTAREQERDWVAVSSNADGYRLLAAEKGGRLYYSTNSGSSWNASQSARNWRAVAVSADGETFVAAVDGGHLYVSTNGGFSWTETGTVQNYRSVASSADGTKLIATTNIGRIFRSTDSGATWTQLAHPVPDASVASSADGLKLVLAGYFGKLFTSRDGGTSWVLSRSTTGNWMGVSSSPDGSRLVALDSGGIVFTSNDSGTSWKHAKVRVAGIGIGSTSVLASSADAGRIFVSNGSDLFSNGDDTVAARPSSSVSLTYLGDDAFWVDRASGDVESPAR